MAMHQPMRLSHQSFELHGYVQVGMSKWHRCWQGGEQLRTLPPLVGIGATLIWGICPGSHGLLAEASVLAGVRMLVHIPPLSSVGVMLSIGAGLSWRAIWAVGIQGGCTCQLFLLNSIFENLGAYGGPSGPWRSRAAVPASRSSSTPSLRLWGLMEGCLGCGDPGRLYLPAIPPQLHLWDSGGLWRAPPPFTGMLQPLRAPQGTTAAQKGQWVGGNVERSDWPKRCISIFV